MTLRLTRIQCQKNPQKSKQISLSFSEYNFVPVDYRDLVFSVLKLQNVNSRVKNMVVTEKIQRILQVILKKVAENQDEIPRAENRVRQEGSQT